jgi:hypothetical protein
MGLYQPRARTPTPNLGLGPAHTDASIAIPLPRSSAPPDDPTLVMQGAPPVRRAAPPGVVVPPAGAPPVPGADDAAAALFDDQTQALPRERPRKADDVSQPTAPFMIGAVVDRARQPEESVPEVVLPAPPSVPRPGAEEPPQESSSIPSLTPTPGPTRPSYYADEEPRFSGAVSARRSGAARWIVGLVVVGMVALAFATVGRKMLTSTPASSAPTSAPAGDARIAGLIAGGEKSLAEGDVESAKEQLDKASVLAERNPHVLAALARLAVARADVDWLRVRLLPADDPNQPVARGDLEQAAQRARKAADRASEVAPNDPAVVRSRIDALRLSGDLEGARKLVAGISATSAQPDSALVLATLDLAEAKPEWSTLLGRLRAALPADGNLGRGRSLLVYALARSGDVAGAKAEIERLAALPRPHPLLGTLKLYVARMDKATDAPADSSARPAAGKASAAVAPGPLPRDPKPSGGGAVEPKPPPAPEGPLVPTGPIDTSDLPGVKVPVAPPPSTGAPPSPPPSPSPTPAVPPGVDTSDLPGFK